MIAAIYNQNSGKIRAIYNGPDEFVDIQLQAGELYLQISEMVDDGAVYVSMGEVALRPTQNTQVDKMTLLPNGADTITISNIPDNSTMLIKSMTAPDEVSGPALSTETFSTTIPGEYKLTVSCWPYLDYEVVINAI